MTTTPNLPSDPNISPVTIEEEMKRSYLDYAMSVIVSRALPDVRDGLKPVHRRIIHAMNENGYYHNRPFRKSARIVGDVMGKYHPHGDSAIYDAMVRMAQDFSMRLPLIDGQGNFGSMDGDKAAAMRYTEARMTLSVQTMVEDIDKETVDFVPNYDETTAEPSVLPARFPNLLVNGAGGIAVGMATNVPPHNLGEVIDACCAVLDDPDVTIEELIENHIQGPDFPTGGIILGRQGIFSAFKLGRGSVVMRGKTHVEEVRKDRHAIVVTEVPYQVNKARMIEIMADAVRDKRIEGISDLRDESDREGVRVVIELRRDAEPEIVLNQLYRFTPLQTSFGVQMLALNGGKPEMLNLKQILEAFIEFREEVIRRRTVFLLGKAREKAHVLAGLAVAVANIDEIIRLIREAPDPSTARAALLDRAWPAEDIAPLIALLDEPDRGVEEGLYRLSETQARAILDLRLHRLTGLERDKIAEDLRALGIEIEDYLGILASRERLRSLLREEIMEIREKFANPRRTVIEENEFEHDIEDLIQREDMVVTVTNTGYIKRVPLSAYRAQRRGGKGRSGMSTRDEDFVSQVFVVNTHTPVLFFTSNGMVFKLKVYRLPLGSPQARGKAMINILPLKDGETISTLMPLPEDESTWNELSVVFATASGNVRRNQLSDFTNVMTNGKIAMRLDEGDRLVRVRTFTDDDDILLFSRQGRCVRFPATDVRVFSSRTSTGVRGIRLAEGDEVIGLSGLAHSEADVETRAAYLRMAGALRRSGDEENGDDFEDGDDRTLSNEEFEELQASEEFVLTITEKGFGKRTSSYEYRVMGRGVQGVATIDVTPRNGEVVAAFPVIDDDQLVMVSDGGQLIRIGVHDIRIAGRKTQGVTLFKVAEGERVVSVTRLRDVETNGSGTSEDGAEDDSEVSDDTEIEPGTGETAEE